MGDGAQDALRSYIRAGMPAAAGRPTSTCHICGDVAYDGNICRPGARRLKNCPRNPDNWAKRGDE